MLRAIKLAAAETTLFKGSTLANGLRAIRTFEILNGVDFDPHNNYHLSTVHGMGVHEGIFRRARIQLSVLQVRREARAVQSLHREAA